MVFRLGAVIPVPTDATSFYRGIGPLTHLVRLMGGELQVSQAPPQINWPWLATIDALFIQRPYHSSSVQLMQLAKANGKTVWIDYDDDLFAVPIQNPAHTVYRNKETEISLTTLIAQADVVTVSTEALRRKAQAIIESLAKRTGGDREGYPRLDPNKVVLIPNAYDSSLFNYSFRQWDREPAPALLNLMWRGSHTHDADLSFYTRELAAAFNKHGEGWTLNFVGSPWWGTIKALEENGIGSDRALVTPTLDIIEYMHYLLATQPAAVFVPLVDDPFNQAKSNIGWIEATHAGAVCLAPDWEEWRRPGVINYKSPEDFQEKVGAILRGIDRERLLQQSRDFIREHLTLDVVNRRRQQVIELLCGLDPWE